MHFLHILAQALQEVHIPWSRQELFLHSTRLIKMLEQQPVFEPEELEFLWQSCVKEQDKGHAGKLISKIEMDMIHGEHRWAPVPAFPHVQPCGKIRRIDNAKRGGHNKATRLYEKIHLCNAFAPGVAAKLLCQEFCRNNLPYWDYKLETGTEDLPDAYRSLPCTEQDLAVNIVAVREPETHKWHFVQMFALLFGFESAVNQFNRWSGFTQAVVRVIGSILWFM